MAPAFPIARLRRLRRTEALRGLVRETAVTANDLIQPLFIEEGIDEALPIAEMPGVSRIPERKLEHVVEGLARDGVKALMLFGISHHKDASGSDAWNRDGLVARMVRKAKRAAPELVVIPDICFCEYTDHGHCGVIEHDHVANDVTIENLARQAVVAADAGADMIAPSAMMDGQVAAIRHALDAAGHPDAPIMAYRPSSPRRFYGPFRVAAGCELKGDRKTYQMDPMNGREACGSRCRTRPRARYADGQARIGVSGCAGEAARADAVADRGLPGERRILDDQVRGGGRGVERAGRGA